MNEAMVLKLKDESKTDPTLNAVVHDFALRRRTRSQITLHALEQRMKLEGFTWTRDQCRNVLKLLGSCGVGKIDTDKEGNVIAIRDIKVTLQSIGRAVVGKEPIKQFNKRNTFGKLAVVPTPQPPKRRGRKPRAYQTPGSRIVLTIIVNEKPVNIPVPSDLTPTEIAELISGFNGGKL